MRHDYAHQEIARLEALEHEEPVAITVEVQQWVPIEGEDGAYTDVSTVSYDIKRGDPPYRFTNDTPDGEYRAVESLDDFMREREAKREPAEAVEPTPEEAATMLDIAFEPQPASRELVERMVREATSHSLWPVTIVVPDPREPTGYHVVFHRPGKDFGIALEYGALSPWEAGKAESMESLILACGIMRACVDYYNGFACPACNGSAKVRGYFFGEKQCPDCEGTGVR